ncbi:unnamed protein product [Calicophoron daubneyi]|uniref:Stabilizer of axonemal microtubules 1 n=1 Tax=Calicophoron daubneyi TaxID=300641 RepID=A0AAV2SYP6_CALDB
MRCKHSKCICQICRCGKHHCPICGSGSNPLDCLTEYNENYKFKVGNPRHPIYPPKAVHTVDEPIKTETTMRIDYVAKPLEKQSMILPLSVIRTEGKFVDDTEYKHSFPSDYLEWSRENFANKRQENTWKPPKDPLSSLTSYRDDYFEKPLGGPVSSYQPKYKGLLQTGLVDTRSNPNPSLSDYRENFVPPPSAVPNRTPVKSHAPPREYQLPFDAVSTFTSDYGRKETEPVAPIRPPRISLKFGQDNLELCTTHRAEFLTWPLTPVQKHGPVYLPSSKEPMEKNTTYRDYFQNRAVPNQARSSRAGSMNNRLLAVSDKFYALSDYKDNYHPWAVRPLDESVSSRKNTYMPSQGRLIGSSTTHRDYRAYPENSFEIHKPKAQIRPCVEPHNPVASIYRKDYVRKPLPICPVIELNHPGSTYKYDGPNFQRVCRSVYPSATDLKYTWQITQKNCAHIWDPLMDILNQLPRVQNDYTF